MMAPKKKLIEVALPLDAINKASAREKSMRHGHPSTLHLWWARRPLATARAVIFAQMVDDPSAHPDLFPTEKSQEKERQRLFGIIEDLVQWENTTNEKVLQAARDEILQSWRSACAVNVDHPQAKQLFDRHKLPGFHDPFAGGGALPLEAQRLGLESYASDLNPVAVLINRSLIEIPPAFAGKPPVNPEARATLARSGSWRAAQGLAEDVRYYGSWLRSQAEARIGHLYPSVEITRELVKERPDLKQYVGKKLQPMAWIWARTVRSPNPAYREIEVPLASSFILSTKAGKEAYVEPVVDQASYRFAVKLGKPKAGATNGTKLARGANFRCLMSGVPIAGDYIKSEAMAGRMGARLMAVVAEGDRARVYLPPTQDAEAVALSAKPAWSPDGAFVHDARAFTPCIYGLSEWRHLFSERQLVALTTFTDLIEDTRKLVVRDALASGVSGREEAERYANAVGLYLAFLVDQVANHSSTLCGWNSANTQMRSVFARQALAMTWDYAESNPFCDSSGSFNNLFERQVKGFEALGVGARGHAVQADANRQGLSVGRVVSTDPPYYDNVPYADLSDFFYVWLRRSQRLAFGELFETMAVPKAEEIVAFGYRQGSKAAAEKFFLESMRSAMHRIAEQAHPEFPITIYYAFKQAETDDGAGTASTGWETFVEAVLQAGFSVTGTWPMRTEKPGRVRENEANALASSIVLVCRRRPQDAPGATRRELVAALKAEVPVALAHLQRGNVAPVDLAQAAIGPGMAVFTRYSKVLDAQGRPLPVREALALINQTLDEALAEQEGDFDADSRWALSWFEQSGFSEGEYGLAETLSKAKNTSVRGLEDAGILRSSRGKVRLLKASELPGDWDPATDARLTAWEVVHHLIRALDAGGELGAAALVARLGTKAEVARELAYRLYTLCERKKRATEALAYNGLVQSWPEITRLAREGAKPTSATQVGLFDKDEE